MPTQRTTNRRGRTNVAPVPNIPTPTEDISEAPLTNIEPDIARGEGLMANIESGESRRNQWTTRMLDEGIRNLERTILFGTDSIQATVEVTSPRDPFDEGDNAIQENHLQHRDKEMKPNDIITLRNGNKAKYKDCIDINGRYYLANDPEITTDYFNPQTYCEKRNCGTLFVDFNEDGTVNPKNVCYYIPNRNREINSRLIEVRDGNMNVYTDIDVFPKQFYTECISSNRWFHHSIASKAVTQKQLKIKGRKVTNIYKSNGYKPDLKKDYLMGVKSPSYIKTEGKRYSFGLELETISGILPNYVDAYLNYLSIKDGSLRDENGDEYGLEYVSGVLVGDTGLLQAKKLCNTLTKYCIVDKKCGVHLHQGGVKFTNELIVYLYKLHLMVEQQIFNMMPLSRRNNEYCRKLKFFDFTFTESDLNNPNKYKSLIDSYYTDLYTYVSATSELPSAKFNKKTQHPLGAKCGYNHSTARYCWINFVPAMFDTRGGGNNSKTLENRIHQGSTNFTKIKNWILINMGLMWFAENHSKTIALNNEISLKYIMELAYPKTHKQINDYIDLRSAKFNNEDSTKSKQNETADYQEVVEDHDVSLKNL